MSHTLNGRLTATRQLNGILGAVGSGGTNDYNALLNKPSINNVTLEGDKTLAELGIIIPTKTSDIINDSGYITQNEVEIPTIINNTSGVIATFNNGGDNIPVKKLEVAIAPNESGITEVNIVRSGKNIFDSTSVLEAYFYGSNKITSLTDSAMCYALCQPNTTYTISKTAGTRFQVAYTDVLPQIGSTTSNKITNNSASSITVTTGSDSKYIVAWVYNPNSDSGTRQAMIDSVQIEEGSTATTYETPNVIVRTIDLDETLTQGGVLEVTSGILTRTDTTTKQLTGVKLPSKTGLNKVFADTGNINLIEYFNNKANEFYYLIQAAT